MIRGMGGGQALGGSNLRHFASAAGAIEFNHGHGHNHNRNHRPQTRSHHFGRFALPGPRGHFLFQSHRAVADFQISSSRNSIHRHLPQDRRGRAWLYPLRSFRPFGFLMSEAKEGIYIRATETENWNTRQIPPRFSSNDSTLCLSAQRCAEAEPGDKVTSRSLFILQMLDSFTLRSNRLAGCTTVMCSDLKRLGTS
jgi:hypothetical protein